MTYREFIELKYKEWYKKEICHIYRERTQEGEAFSRSYDGLPTLDDEVPEQVSIEDWATRHGLNMKKYERV